MIWEKQSHDEFPDTLPNKKGKIADNSKGKKTVPPLEIKKRVTKSGKVASMGATPVLVPEEVTSANPSAIHVGESLRGRKNLGASDSNC